MVIAIGLLEMTVDPERCRFPAIFDASALKVSPMFKTMVNGTPAGCPTMSLEGTMVMDVLFCVATISKPDRA